MVQSSTIISPPSLESYDHPLAYLDPIVHSSGLILNLWFSIPAASWNVKSIQKVSLQILLIQTADMVSFFNQSSHLSQIHFQLKLLAVFIITVSTCTSDPVWGSLIVIPLQYPANTVVCYCNLKYKCVGHPIMAVGICGMMGLCELWSFSQIITMASSAKGLCL